MRIGLEQRGFIRRLEGKDRAIEVTRAVSRTRWRRAAVVEVVGDLTHGWGDATGALIGNA